LTPNGVHLILPAARRKFAFQTRNYLMRFLLASACCFLALGVVSGCIFSPHTDKGCTDCNQPPPVYPGLINPFSVLDALESAYSHRDSTEIKLIYDINYAGSSFDPKTPGQLVFTKQDEIRHVEGLYRTTSITEVSLKFPPNKVRYTDSADPPGWATIQIQNMTLDISDSQTSYNLLTSETFEFKFIPYTPDSTSPTDTTWKIVRWTELP
jgi:hypothetical protein